MESWVRYSVAVYVGLLLAGASVGAPDGPLGRRVQARMTAQEIRQSPMFKEAAAEHGLLLDRHGQVLQQVQQVDADDAAAVTR